MLWFAPACLWGRRNKRGIHLVSMYFRAATTKGSGIKRENVHMCNFFSVQFVLKTSTDHDFIIMCYIDR